MSRIVTAEDCLKVIPNRFDMTLAAAKRARQLAMSIKEPKVDPGDDKVTVVALREIAAGYTDFTDKVIVEEDIMETEEIAETTDVADASQVNEMPESVGTEDMAAADSSAPVDEDNTPTDSTEQD